MNEADTVILHNEDLWVKVVEFLQQNWALIEDLDSGVRIFFISDSSGVFDQLDYESRQDAEAALRRNGFNRYSDDIKAQQFLRPPSPPYRHSPHTNGPIYSSGRFWVSQT
jgi:hypothetical protein